MNKYFGMAIVSAIALLGCEFNNQEKLATFFYPISGIGLVIGILEHEQKLGERKNNESKR